MEDGDLELTPASCPSQGPWIRLAPHVTPSSSLGSMRTWECRRADRPLPKRPSQAALFSVARLSSLRPRVYAPVVIHLRIRLRIFLSSLTYSFQSATSF